MNRTIGYFSFQAGFYDAYQSSCIPKYEEMVNVTTQFVAWVCGGNRELVVLDAGCGTGNTTAEVLRLVPGARVTCLDGSQQMIREAKKKLHKWPVDFECLDLSSPDWSDKWDGLSFDAIVSVLVLEHLDPLAYRSCLSQFLRILRPGGALVAVEGYAGQTLQELFFHEMAVAETNAVRTGAVTQELLAEIKRRSAQDETHHYTTVDEKKAWWLEHGFVDVEFIWQYYCAAILTGRKPS